MTTTTRTDAFQRVASLTEVTKIGLRTVYLDDQVIVR